MSKDYEIQCEGHNSIYTANFPLHNYQERHFLRYYSLPDAGVNERTGILLFIAGFGGHAQSNVYKKMRRLFADQYNLVTIQCDYFGSEFMQNAPETALSREMLHTLLQTMTIDEVQEKARDKAAFISFVRAQNIEFRLEALMDETLARFADMSYMQAIDNVTAVLKVIDILEGRGLSFNTEKIIAFGQSQGSYLSYFCHAITRNLFTHILDNSSWLQLAYMTRLRQLLGDLCPVQFRYLAVDVPFELAHITLTELCKGFRNTCQIAVYHGTGDCFDSPAEKQAALADVANVTMHIITDADVPNEVFHSTAHGLDADFLKLFDLFYREYVDESHIGGQLRLRKRPHVRMSGIEVDYTSGKLVVASFSGLKA